MRILFMELAIIPSWPRHHRKEMSKELDFNDKRIERILNIIGKHFEDNMFTAIANMTVNWTRINIFPRED
jgi:hypothetical protein